MKKTAKSQRPPLASNVAKRRKAIGLNQEEFADLVGVHLNTIKLIERGLSEGHADTRQAIATALGCTIADLYIGPLDEIRSNINTRVTLDEDQSEAVQEAIKRAISTITPGMLQRAGASFARSKTINEIVSLLEGQPESRLITVLKIVRDLVSSDAALNGKKKNFR